MDYRLTVRERGTGAIVHSERLSGLSPLAAEHAQSANWSRWSTPGRYRSTLCKVGTRRALLTIE